MLSDTVGFIRNLPHHLVASFRSTLEETVAAHLLLIVLDISDQHAAMQRRTVHDTLDEIGATAQPRILVLNKVDRVESTSALAVWLNRYPEAIAISASTGEGLDDLRAAVFAHFMGDVREVDISLPMDDSKSIMFLEQRARVLHRRYQDSRAVLTVRIGRRQVDRLLANRGVGGNMTIAGLPPHEALQRVWTNGAHAPVKRAPPHLQDWHAPESV
jgi:GTP-binding protein HflX